MTGMPEVCHTCELVARRDAGEAPAWDRIVRTPHWDVVHAFGTRLPGWLVLVLRRHAAAVAELTGEESAELGPLTVAASCALGDVVGCAKTYIAQFAEHPNHPHVHVHVVPRSPDLQPECVGPRIFDLMGGDPESWVPESTMVGVADALREHPRLAPFA